MDNRRLNEFASVNLYAIVVFFMVDDRLLAKQ